MRGKKDGRQEYHFAARESKTHKTKPTPRPDFFDPDVRFKRDRIFSSFLSHETEPRITKMEGQHRGNRGGDKGSSRETFYCFLQRAREIKEGWESRGRDCAPEERVASSRFSRASTLLAVELFLLFAFFFYFAEINGK